MKFCSRPGAEGRYKEPEAGKAEYGQISQD